jgi:hypothetical protein
MKKIITNGHIRNIEYDFFKIPGRIEKDEEEEPCFQYKGETYFVSEFVEVSETAFEHSQGWEGVIGLTAFSAILIKFVDNGVIVGYETV